ncbi:hypothetical protein BAUCODRAFT_210636 [Baudoinia panamericana UAMH 10762]|uniref:Major facilitator superfamily (MFS) profile domain-containing protein n=1 Tax=Baudoinia panamericana (strain UAMH 10762) TaxID=717646 RepID=M2MBB6_BAUPA|nr:uncharacterized protein BAUCODRAFT_210636 [Baudoinia panamericana UAMH 10762]EMC93791.1 hypothetical protein BAUCODRAFT_210636 [Baudoinia panamericana UAMH 10762]
MTLTKTEQALPSDTPRPVSEAGSSREPDSASVNILLAPIRPEASHARTSPRPKDLGRQASNNRLAEEAGSASTLDHQGVPPELGSLTKEVIFVLVCSSGQLLFAFFYGDVVVNQQTLKVALGLQNTQLPWLVGSFLVANGLSVVVAGSLADLLAPKRIVLGALVWQALWNLVGAFSVTPSRVVLFFIVRAMQGLSVGVLVSGSMSILGRVYAPGLRKTRVFSAMAAGAPVGFWIGLLQGGALSAHLPWIFGTNAMMSVLLCLASLYTIPPMQPVADTPGADVPGLRRFDFKGAVCAMAGCVCLLFGLTQGPAVNWAPYTYSLIIVGILLLVLFPYIESKVPRPIIPTRLWKTPGFAPLMAAYFLGFGGFIGPWQFYAIQFFLRFQNKPAIIVALYMLPNAIVGVAATFLVSRLLHLIPGHYIYISAMLAFACGPALFLPQTPSTPYWALSMPGVALATFGPDLSFAAASIFITSNVARSYQGSAGSLLATIQNLSAAIMTSVGDAIGAKVDLGADGEIGLKGIKAAWWFALAAALSGAVITAVSVRIPKEEEKEHVT